MKTPRECLDDIIAIFELGGESEMYLKTVKLLFELILLDKEENTYSTVQNFKFKISIHNKLRSSKYNEDFNGPLLMWYRRFIGLHGGLK
jgi:hypothetical protein